MATIPPDADAPRRRMLIRRGRGGFGAAGAGNSTRSESLRMADRAEVGDEVDEAIQPENLNDRVRANLPTIVNAPVHREPDYDGGAAEGNPRARLNDVAMAGSSGYAKEYRLGLLHRLILRGVPLDQIARQLQVSVSTVEKDRAELRNRLRQLAKELNIDEMVSTQNAFYDEVRSMSLRLASAGGENGPTTPMRLASLRTALAAEADRTRFLNSAGVLDVLRFRRADDGNDLSDVQRLMEQTDTMMAELLREDAEPPQRPQPPKAKARPRVRRPGGFNEMTFDDAGASSSDGEVVEL